VRRGLRVAMFYHSLVSDWNHGNAHFLRGVVDELLARGCDVRVFEPHDAWSRVNLVADHGEEAVAAFERAYPGLVSERYDPRHVDVDRLLEGVDLIVVHEWSDPDLVARVGRYRRRTGSCRLLFHDTHHRAVTDRAAMAAYDLRDYDGVLAFGEVLRGLYLREGWIERAWTWHEAADVRRFRPRSGAGRDGDLVWIGNWGDDERSEELATFLLEPVRALRLTARAHGVRYPEAAERALARAGMASGGYLPNFRVPDVFARFALTVHVPRRPYVEALPGIPTIRPFEALACGIPLVCSPWDDVEGLFTPGRDYLVARDGAAMRACLRAVLHDDELARDLAQHGHETILARHTCAHRVDELMAIAVGLGCGGAAGLGALAEPADARGVPHDREVLRP
jgi:spore maturation protein CgeB